MTVHQCIEVQAFSEARFSIPPWFAEVVIVARYLATSGLVEAFGQQVRLVRGRFGKYEPLDFLAPLIGYALSGERTLADFFDRLAPFAPAFMALFGRKCLPHRSSLSRFLAGVDRPCLEAFRTLFEQFRFPEGWSAETIGGIWDRQGRRYIVFDVDGTRQAARQRALPCDPTLPPARRRFDAVCAPGDIGPEAWRGGPNADHSPPDAYTPMGRHVWRPREWGLPRRTSFGSSSHEDVSEVGLGSLRKSYLFRWAMQLPKQKRDKESGR